jgi:DNA helicase-2/ATP-dependent DNA helicase PcrA
MRQIELMLDGLPDPASDARPAPAPELSVTNLVTLAQCPRRFEWTAIDPLPQRRSAARARGVALHRRIELHNRGQAPFEELRDDLYDAPESDEATEYEGGFAAFRASRYGTRRPRWTEAAIDLAVPAGRVRGRIDAIYEDGEDGWEIVDFKSGRRSSDPARRVQLQAYAVAVADGALGVAAPSEMSVSFVYLGGAMDVETEHVDAAWLEAARDDLQDLVASAQRDRYEPRPGAACAGCDFLRFCDEGAAHVADDRDLSPGRRPPR